MGEGKGFFDISVNINREEAERKLAEYRGIAKPRAGPLLDHPPPVREESAIVERSPFQRRLRWVFFRLLKLGVALGVSTIIAGLGVILSNMDSLHRGEFEHKLSLGNAEVAVSDPNDTDGFAVKITKEEGTCAVYERADSGVWRMSLLDKGSELNGEEEGVRLRFERRQWMNKHPNVKLLRKGNTLRMTLHASDIWLEVNATINTTAGTYVDFSMAGASRGKEAVILAQAIFSVVTIGLVLLMFWRDLKLLARYLGSTMKSCRALLTAAGAAAGAKVVSALGALLLIVPAVLRSGRSALLPGRPVEQILGIPEGFHSPIETMATNAVGIVAFSCIVPAAEELVFRGVLFLICLRLLGKRGAVLVTSGLFVLYHHSTYPMVPVTILMLGVAGVSAALVLLWTRRLRWSIVFHSAFNALAFTAWSAVP
ncbi:MAG: CPBP family intramembrane metalloprotease [Candidatus Coatesbacteria bacterium]|nr:CPBP family intramembrane metalloprotease [Candidatus Coatesbacteria bacterium]